MGWIVKFIVSAPCRFHRLKGLRLLTVTRLFGPCRLVQLSVVMVQLFPFFPFNFLCTWSDTRRASPHPAAPVNTSRAQYVSYRRRFAEKPLLQFSRSIRRRLL